MSFIFLAFSLVFAAGVLSVFFEFYLVFGI